MRLVTKFKYSPNRSRTYEVLVTGPDALPLSYRRLVGAKATKLQSVPGVRSSEFIGNVRRIANFHFSPKDFLSSALSESISLQPLTVGELNNMVKSFNANKAPGHDNISMKIIHQSFQNIAQPLVTIINTSLSTGVFPESLKIAKVIPVFKADDPTLLKN